MHDDTAALVAWLDLAEEVARHHRQGQVLATDPSLVLRGLPPMWRPVARSGSPADDVVALAGTALERLGPGDGDLRPALVEAAAGCLGSDLPALLRRVRPVVAGRPDRPGGAGGATPSRPGVDPAEPDPPGRPWHRHRGGSTGPGRRLALAGGLAATTLAVLGAAGAWPSTAATPQPERPAGPSSAAADRPTTTEPVALSARPTPVAGVRPASVAWDPPHLVVDVEGTRYRYRLDGPVDRVALAAGGGGATVVVTTGERQWALAVPALDAAEPGPTGSHRVAGPGSVRVR